MVFRLIGLQMSHL